jgi:hypothetical protein
MKIRLPDNKYLLNRKGKDLQKESESILIFLFLRGF